jgi:predicted Rossmann fold nucleotide-binding protein DprA/Smf involved in DNA uptake
MVEGPEDSGALITAQFALDQGRDLWVGGAGMRSPRGGGNRRLAADGAPVLESAAELLAQWGMAGPVKPAEAELAGPVKSPGTEAGPETKRLSPGEALAHSAMEELLQKGKM